MTETIAPDSLTGLTNRIAEAQERLRDERKTWEGREAGLKADIALLEDEKTHLVAGTPPADRMLATHVVEVTGQGQGWPKEGKDRHLIIADAIKDIAAGAPRLREEYFGRKFYSGVDQREDYRYGRGPKHGTIVFRVELTKPVRDRLAGGGELTQAERDATILYLTNVLKAGVA